MHFGPTLIAKIQFWWADYAVDRRAGTTVMLFGDTHLDTDWLHEYDALLPAGDEGWIAQVINVLVNAIVFTALFAAMFKWLPDAVIRWRDTLVGAGITAALFLIGQFGMGFYFGMKEEGTYGVASSFVLLLLWVYYSSMIFLLGAEFTQVWARLRGMEITPEPGAVRVERQTVRSDAG